MTDDVAPHERAILTFYHVLKIKDPQDLQRTLNYKDRSSVDKVLSKFRGTTLWIKMSQIEAHKPVSGHVQTTLRVK